MEAKAFAWFVFQPLLPGDTVMAVGKQPNLREAYGIWIGEYSQRWRKFSTMQLDRHAEYAYRVFCWAYGLDPEVGLYEWDFDYSDVYDAFLRAHGYEDHRLSIESVDSDVDWLSAAFAVRQPGLRSAAEIVEDLYANLWGDEHQPALWAHWFEKQTRVSDATQSALHALPYRDYLKSSYWKRVRAAMLLIGETRCQGVPCVSRDSWYGGTFDLNVHHLHYKNKGREQLSNLILLCSECHKRVHDGDLSVLASPDLSGAPRPGGQEDGDGIPF